MGNYFEMQWMMFITQFLLIPAVILSAYAQIKVTTTFAKYSKIGNSRGMTGAEVASQILSLNGINDVQIERVRGNLTDHYDPLRKTLRLSDAVYNVTSISALSVAAHEVGHAIQHHEGYIPLKFRSAVYPITAIASKMSMPLIVIGLLFSSTNGIILEIGIIMFVCVVIFQVITLPVEFNASRRAINNLQKYNFLNDNEIEPAKQVLRAAALTYVAAALSAILQLVRLLVIANSREDN